MDETDHDFDVTVDGLRPKQAEQALILRFQRAQSLSLVLVRVAAGEEEVVV